MYHILYLVGGGYVPAHAAEALGEGAHKHIYIHICVSYSIQIIMLY